MSLISYENFRKGADNPILSDIVVSGRYEFQIEDEKRIVPNVINKLDLQPNDRLLDIGCGPGILLLPLSYFVGEAWGIDNEAAIKRVCKKSKYIDNIHTIVGYFLETDFSSFPSFDKILVYGVIHYLSSENELMQFLSKALKLLSPGGRMLIGDVPNSDKKSRFEQSPSGIDQVKTWRKMVAKNTKTKLDMKLPNDPELVYLDDDCYLRILKFTRSKGFESYLLPEPENLPFGRTRDDILLIAHR